MNDFQRHVAPEAIPYDPARKLIVGLDAGLTSAAVYAAIRFVDALVIIDPAHRRR